MSPSTSTTALLLAVVGIALAFNAVWLFPQEGEGQYTYERVQVTVEDGKLTYRAETAHSVDEYNDLVAVDCDSIDTTTRACAFDRYLVDHGAVTVDIETTGLGPDTPAFVELADGYYHRTIAEGPNGTTLDVEPIEPRALLGEIATDVSGADPDGLSESAPAQFRAAITGDAVTTTETPDSAEVGEVFLRNGTYYAVVVTDDSGEVDAPLFEEWFRVPLSVAGAGALVAAFVVAVGGWNLDRWEPL